MRYGKFLLAGLEKTYILLATFPWLELSLWSWLIVRSQEETGLTLCPGEREFGGVGEHKVWETTPWVTFLQSKGEDGVITSKKLPFIF